MSKRHVCVLVIVAFLVGMWVGDGLRSPAAAQSGTRSAAAPAAPATPAAPAPAATTTRAAAAAPAAAQRPMFQEVVVPDKNGEQGAVYMIYNGPGQICPVSTQIVQLKAKAEKPAYTPKAPEKPVYTPKTPDKTKAK